MMTNDPHCEGDDLDVMDHCTICNNKADIEVGPGSMVRYRRPNPRGDEPDAEIHEVEELGWSKGYGQYCYGFKHNFEKRRSGEHRACWSPRDHLTPVVYWKGAWRTGREVAKMLLIEFAAEKAEQYKTTPIIGNAFAVFGANAKLYDSELRLVTLSNKRHQMPKIDFNFSGSLQGVIVTEATNSQGDEVDVRKLSAPELCRRLESGELFISLGKHLYDSDDAEIILEDFQTTPGWPDEV